MEATPLSPPSSSNPEWPRVTYFLFCYNQQKFLPRAVESALAQDYPNLEIILSDDCSTDRSFEVLRLATEGYQGSHDLRLNRNSQNLGLIGHVNRAFELASGELVVLAAGDDYSVPGRVSAIVRRYLAEEPRPLLIHSSVRKVQDGVPGGVWVPPVVAKNMSLLDIASAGALYIGATGCISRRLHEIFGPIKYDHAFEDLVFGFRAALLCGMTYIDEPLVEYTTGVGLNSQRVYKGCDLDGVLASRASSYRILLAVLTQRAADLGSVASELAPSLVRTIGRRVRLERRKLKARLGFYGEMQPAIVAVLSAPSWRVFRALASEAWFLVRARLELFRESATKR